MVGTSPAMLRVFEEIRRLAASPVPVLILGETGTGKELAARAIWRLAGSRKRFIPVNCGAIHTNLIESELFGHERGAFTGASGRRVGLLAEANGGVLFLDEVAELPVQAQVKLLRVLDTGEYRALGGNRLEHSSLRLLAATHRDLEARVARGAFREDLLYRFGAARLEMPALRQRPSDIPALASWFLNNTEIRHTTHLSEKAVRLLCRSRWPGNVRQLKYVIETAAALAGSGPIDAAHIESLIPAEEREEITDSDPRLKLTDAIEDAQARAIRVALAEVGGNRKAAAELLGISPRTLYRRLARLNGSL